MGTILYKVATDADVAVANFTFDGDTDAEDMVGGIMAFSGVDVIGGFDALGTPNNGPFDIDPGTLGPILDSDILNAPSITTTSDNVAIVMVGMITDNRRFDDWNTTSPGALTEVFEVEDNADADLAIGTAWAIKPSFGATGAGTADLKGGSDDESRSILLALRPACFPPTITSQSTAGETISVCTGTSFSPIAVSASGVGLSYQWYENTTGLTSGGTAMGTDSPNFTPSPPSDGNGYYYYVVVTASCGTASSAISGEFILSENQVEYLTPGLQTFYVPAGVTFITVETWGAGGRGSTRITETGRGSGGGGGAYSQSVIAVTPGEAIAVFVGSGSASILTGEPSWIARTESPVDAIVLAVGGESGLDDSGGDDPGNGGLGVDGIGDITFDGGSGANRGNSRNGGGGSSAGNAANGNSPTPPNDANRVNGAPAPAGGGAGGNGGPEIGNNTSLGLPGMQPCGGGGGGER